MDTYKDGSAVKLLRDVVCMIYRDVIVCITRLSESGSWASCQLLTLNP